MLASEFGIAHPLCIDFEVVGFGTNLLPNFGVGGMNRADRDPSGAFAYLGGISVITFGRVDVFIPCAESPLVLCSGMGYGSVRNILEKAISSPAEVDLPELDDAIQWVEDRGTIRRLDRGTDRNVYSPQFDAAAVEMRVLRRLLANGQLAGATASAQRVSAT